MKYDVIIIGGGPAGLTAAIYASRYKLKTLVLSKTIGGTAATAHKICNFPSYKEIKGFEIMKNFEEHVKDLGTEIIYNEVIEIKNLKKEFMIKTKKQEYFAKKIIFATGTTHLNLDIPGERKFLGKGVSYCATCDATFFKDKKVCIIGGGDAALTAALLLAEFSPEVYIIYRRGEFLKAEPSWVELIEKNKKIKPIFNEEITEIIGKENVEKVKLKNSKKEIEVQGVFIEVGSKPETRLLDLLKLEKNPTGYIIVDKSQKTNIQGIYAVGDVTNNQLKQIITSSAEGAIAAFNCYKEIKKDN